MRKLVLQVVLLIKGSNEDTITRRKDDYEA